MSLESFPVSEDTGGVLRSFAVHRLAGRDYQGTVVVDAATAVTLAIDASGRITVKRPMGSKVFTDPAPTNAATLVLAANANRISALIQNVGMIDVYLRNTNTVTTSNGILLTAGAALFDEESTDAWWGITGAGTADVRVVEVA